MTKIKVSKRGRPEKPHEEKRNSVLQFRCTADEKKMSEAAAEKAGKSLSDWLRSLTFCGISSKKITKNG